MKGLSLRWPFLYLPHLPLISFASSLTSHKTNQSAKYISLVQCLVSSVYLMIKNGFYFIVYFIVLCYNKVNP